VSKKPLTHVFFYSEMPSPYEGCTEHKTIWVNRKRGIAFEQVIRWQPVSMQDVEQWEKENASKIG
jgi:hypothetical protein